MADKEISGLTSGGAAVAGDKVHAFRTPNSRQVTLGGAAGLSVGTTAGTVAAGDDSRITGAIPSSLLTTRGDIIRRGAAAAERLAKGTQYQVLQAGANDPEWAALNLAQAAAVTGILPAANLPDASTGAKGIAEQATAAEYRAGTDTTRFIGVAEAWAAAVPISLTDAATIALDFGSFLNFAVCTLAGNRALGDPTNVKAGQPFILGFIGSGSTRTLTLHSDFQVAAGVEVGPYSITTTQWLYICGFAHGDGFLRVTGIVRV